MDLPEPAVKARRPYVSPRRTARAQRTRAAVVDAAEELFLRDGFGPTTVAAVAVAAGVSVETVYKAFGGKPGLVRAICERALAGSGQVSAETRSDELQRDESDPYVIIRGWGRLMQEVSPRISPLMLLLRAAAAIDPEMDLLQAELEAQRMHRMTRNAGALASAGHLREGVTVEEAADLLWFYSSAEVFELLVRRRRWSVERYADSIADAMIAALLTPHTPG